MPNRILDIAVARNSHIADKYSVMPPVTRNVRLVTQTTIVNTRVGVDGLHTVACPCPRLRKHLSIPSASCPYDLSDY